MSCAGPSGSFGRRTCFVLTVRDEPYTEAMRWGKDVPRAPVPIRVRPQAPGD